MDYPVPEPTGFSTARLWQFEATGPSYQRGIARHATVAHLSALPQPVPACGLAVIVRIGIIEQAGLRACQPLGT